MGIKKDANSRLRSSGTGQNSSRNNIIPKSVRIVSYLTSANLGSIASTMQSAGAAVTSLITQPDGKDQVLWAGFDKLELGRGNVRCVLLLGYVNGFQIFDIEEANNIQVLVSKRDGAVAFLKIQPTPFTSEASKWRFESHKPLLLIVKDGVVNEANYEYKFGIGYGRGVGGLSQVANSNFVSTAVHFYSLRYHSYVHQLGFHSAIFAVRCSSSALAVALATQICCFDPATLEKTYSVLTYPIIQGSQVLGGVNVGYGPVDVGPRWLAYSPSQALVSDMDHMSSRRLTPVPRIMKEKSMKHYAKESGKQLAAGIFTLGGMGYKKLSKYCSDHIPDSINFGGTVCKDQKCSKNGSFEQASEPDYAGMIIVRDLVTKDVITQFRAHESPISALCFDPSGTLLVTASVHGNNLNVFQIMPSKAKYSPGCTVYDWKASYVHLYKLYRGRTDAIIQDISFSNSREWIVISSARGTCHLFTISPFGGVVCQDNHADTSTRSALFTVLPWWSIPGSVRENQQPLPPPPPPISLTVDSKIKNSSGWLNAMSDVATAAAGKTRPPSGAIAAIFHNGGGDNKQSAPGNYNDQLWVFAPSGCLIQHVLYPYIGAESISNVPHTGTSCEQTKTMGLEVGFNRVQSWDVCRRSNHMEREEAIEVSDDRKEENIESSSGDRKSEDPGRPYWNVINAEGHTYNRRASIWSRPRVWL